MKKSVILIGFFFIIYPYGFSSAETVMDRLVKKIVRPADSNDTKVYKIEKWVMINIQYSSDKEQYNVIDRWTLPWETLQRKKGDCEDGATLIIALAVTAGVPENRLRLYAPINVYSGWHAAVAYQRETDDEWVWVEWTIQDGCYSGPIEKRPGLIESFVFFTFRQLSKSDKP